MTSRIQNNRSLLAGLFALAAVAVAVAFLLLQENGAPEQTIAPDVPEARVQLESWPTGDDAQPVRLSVDPKEGPIWQRGGEPVVLTPQSDDLSFESWSVETLEDRTRVTGTGNLGEAKASAVWTFVDGNPQAHLALEFLGVSSDRLTATIELVQRRVGREQGVLEDEPLVLWRPVLGLECDKGEDPASFDLRTQQIVTLQQAPAITRWPYANGASAQLVPVFDLPGNHPDPQIAETAAKDASAWLRRARTLIYGHSNPKDPRYGNGGLLGHALGATIAVPAIWADDAGVLELARDLRGTRVELAASETAKNAALESTRFAIAPSCRTLVDLGKKGVPAAIVDMAKAQDDALAVSNSPLLATAAPIPLDGQLSSLLKQGFDTQTLDQMVRRRARLVFSTPFVATRNPLIGAAQEALLEPERDGQWTVDARLSEALADLELWREATPLVVTSIGAAASHASASRRVLHWWTSDGRLRVYNPGAKMIAGYTLVVDGSAGAEIARALKGDEGDQAAVSSRQILLDGERQATLLWWDLEPGVHTLELSDKDGQVAQPRPVTWQLDQL